MEDEWKLLVKLNRIFNNHLENIIENNYGGVIVFDLSEKFGYDPVDY